MQEVGYFDGKVTVMFNGNIEIQVSNEEEKKYVTEEIEAVKRRNRLNYQIFPEYKIKETDLKFVISGNYNDLTYALHNLYQGRMISEERRKELSEEMWQKLPSQKEVVAGAGKHAMLASQNATKTRDNRPTQSESTPMQVVTATGSPKSPLSK